MSVLLLIVFPPKFFVIYKYFKDWLKKKPAPSNANANHRNRNNKLKYKKQSPIEIELETSTKASFKEDKFALLIMFEVMLFLLSIPIFNLSIAYYRKSRLLSIRFMQKINQIKTNTFI